MLIAGIGTVIIASLVIFSWFVAAGKDKYKDEWIIQRKKEEKQIDINFKGHLQCDDDCYMCNDQGRCQRTAIK